MKFIRLALSAIAMAWSGQNIYAQTRANDSIPINSLDLKEVIISVNKIQETKQNIAQQVQVITSRDMAQLQAQSTADLMANSYKKAKWAAVAFL
jgi:outer membrane cobalamin receptor